MMDARLKEFGSDPLTLFGLWFEEAKKAEINDPDAVCLATCDATGRPSNRMVLLKDYGIQGFKFHTNSESRKGAELLQNSYAALCFYWKSTRKQIRVEGTVAMVSQQEADEYFQQRPRGRQIGAWASAQSRPLESRDTLEKRIEDMETTYAGQDVPRPPYWNGYRVIPESIEFWIGHDKRLHERFIYRRQKDGTWSPPAWLYP